MIYCTNCGHGNADASNFCSQCGTALEQPAAKSSGPATSAGVTQQSGVDGPGESGTGEATSSTTPSGTGEAAEQDPSRRRTTEQPRSGDTTRTMPALAEDDDSGLDADDVEAVNALPKGSALLIVRRGADAGSRFLVDSETTMVGRSQDADILLDDISVSRRHAVFTRSDSGVTVKDVGSLNGTYVNREMVDEHALRDGDEVQIGKFRLVFYSARS